MSQNMIAKCKFKCRIIVRYRLWWAIKIFQKFSFSSRIQRWIHFTFMSFFYVQFERRTHLKKFEKSIERKRQKQLFSIQHINSKKKTRLNDVKQMKIFRKCVQLQSKNKNDMLLTTFALLIANFFFELKHIFVLKTKHYVCQKFIRCRNDDKIVFDIFTRLHDVCYEICTNTIILNWLNHNDICQICDLYRKRIKFFVRHLKNVVTMNIKHDLINRKINEFSHNVLWFIKQQKFDACFDKRNHDLSK